jgi:predicted component of type VI protein secretion system
MTDERRSIDSTLERPSPVNTQLRLRYRDQEWVVDRTRLEIRVGRAKDNDLCVSDELASRHHGTITYCNGRFYLKDDSRNGTLIIFGERRALYAHQETVELEGDGGIRLGHLDGGEIKFAVEVRTPDGESWQSGITPSLAAEQAVPPGCNVFRQEGDYWTLAYEGAILRLKEAKGLRYLGQLLRHPGREFHVFDLVATSDPRTEGPDPGSDRAAVQAAAARSAGPLLDATAKAAYRRRLEELRDELEEAERFNDVGRASHAREEMDAITGQLAQAVGLRGRDREAASNAERARVMVTLRVKAVLDKINCGHPSLGHHLTTTIHTGRFCSYRPDPTRPISWTF